MATLITNITYLEVGEPIMGTVHHERRIALLFNKKRAFVGAADFIEESKSDHRTMIAEASEAQAGQFTMEEMEAAYTFFANEIDHWFAGKPPRMQTELL